MLRAHCLSVKMEAGDIVEDKEMPGHVVGLTNVQTILSEPEQTADLAEHVKTLFQMGTPTIVTIIDTDATLSPLI